MDPRDWNWLILTITICLCIIVMGGLVVDRTVVDKNYHDPTPQQAAIKAYQDCIGNAAPSDAQSHDCAKLAGTDASPSTSVPPTATPGAKK